MLVLHPDLRQRRNRPQNQLRQPQARLEEARGLAAAIGLEIVDSAIVGLSRARPATLFGRGKVDEIASLVGALEAGLVVVDGQLSPIQQRNLERAWSCKVIDRSALILEIFGARARTREGRLQVELAALEYQRGRLVRSWTHLERQRGGFGFLGGPGETQIEADRRQIAGRLAKIRRELEAVRRTRQLHRASRQKVPFAVAALVGYTNAGKSTLFNRLTEARVEVADQLFATLDPTMRGITLPGGRRLILSDTVGFISQLPTMLVAAFRATLEEVLEANLIVHVRDVAHPDAEAQKEDVIKVLRELGIGEDDERPLIEVLNKTDLLAQTEVQRWQNHSRERAGQVALSALSGQGYDDLLGLFEIHLARHSQILQVTLDPGDGATLAWLYRHGEVLSRHQIEDRIQLEVGLDAANMERFRRRSIVAG